MVEGSVQAQGAYISTEQLADMISTLPAGKLCILNAVVQPDDMDIFRQHAKARIPGARVLDLHMFKDLKSPYPFMMPPQDHFLRLIKAMNIRKSQTVVIYEHGKGWFASRAAFMLKTFGHPNVYILDGNFAKWQRENREIESDGEQADNDLMADFDY